MKLYHIMNIRRNFHWLTTTTVDDARKTIQYSQTPDEYAIYTNLHLAEHVIKIGKYKTAQHIESDLERLHDAIQYITGG